MTEPRMQAARGLLYPTGTPTMLLLLLHGCMQLHSPFPSSRTADLTGNPKALAVAGDCSLAAARGSWFPCRPWAVLAALQEKLPPSGFRGGGCSQDSTSSPQPAAFQQEARQGNGRNAKGRWGLQLSCGSHRGPTAPLSGPAVLC